MTCPYGTYQRALRAHKLTIGQAVASPERFRAAMLSRLSKAGRNDPVFVRAFMRDAEGYLRNDHRIMQEFRL